MNFSSFLKHLSFNTRTRLWVHVQLSMNGICIHTFICLFIFFIDACLYDSSVTGPSVRTLVVFLLLKRGCLVRQILNGWGRSSVGMRPCVLFCKNKPSVQRYLKIIYIMQLKKQASVCRMVTQLDHTTSWNLIIFWEKGIKKLESFFFCLVLKCLKI